MIKEATRESYGKALAEFAEQYDLYVFDADLAEATKTKVFADKYPERFFDCGIAEANMITVAAGMATTGKTVFASSFAMFAAGRAFEQIRNSIGYPHLNVKIGATHAGLSVGEDGATHQCNEDIALMRTIPGMVIINPADPIEARLAVKAAAEHKGPVYLRFGRMAIEQFLPDDYEFKIGKGVVVKDGSDVVIFATGLMVTEAIKAADILKEKGVDAAVINISTIKPLDTELVVEYAKKCGAIVTSEEHSIIGGLGSAIAEVVGENAPCPVIRHGVNDQYGTSAPALKVLEHYGLTADVIVEKALLAKSLKK